MEGPQGILLVHQLRQLGPLVVAQEARQVVVVPRVVQLMAPGVVVQRVVQLMAPGVVVQRVVQLMAPGVVVQRVVQLMAPGVVVQRVVQLMAPGVVVQRVVQLMAPGVVVQRVVQLMAPGVVVPRVGSPVRRHSEYEQVEGPPLLEPVEYVPPPVHLNLVVSYYFQSKEMNNL